MIETKRLTIKPLSLDELRSHVAAPNEMAAEMGVTPSQSLMDEQTKDAILADLLPFMTDPEKGPLFYTMWIVIERSQRAIIGGICFHGEPNEDGEVEIGYGTDVDFRNKGYMTETIEGLLQWLAKNEKVTTVTAESETSNIASARVLQKNGFQIVGQKDNLIQLRLDLGQTTTH